jgi:hypothetical protein
MRTKEENRKDIHVLAQEHREKMRMEKGGKMIKTIVASFKLRGTEKEIERVRARIASLSSLEEVISLYINTKEVENE